MQLPRRRSRLSAAPRWLALTLLVAFAFGPVALCQDSAGAQDTAHAATQPPNEFGILGSVSVNSPDLYGSRAHGDFGALAFRYGRVLSATRHRVIEYTLDVVPAEVLHEYSYVPCMFQSGGLTIATHCTNGYQNVYAGGLTPFGWKFSFLPRHQLQPVAALEGGMVFSTARIPTDIPGGALFNFTATWQLGFQRFNSSRTRAWIFGYKMQHISDAFRTSLNPGIDLNVLFLGYSFFK